VCCMFVQSRYEVKSVQQQSDLSDTKDVLHRLKPCHQAIPLFSPSRVPFSVGNTKLRVEPYDEMGEVECGRWGETYERKH